MHAIFSQTYRTVSRSCKYTALLGIARIMRVLISPVPCKGRVLISPVPCNQLSTTT